MKRSYYRKDRLVEVDELDGVVAVQVKTDDQGNARAVAQDLGASARKALVGSDVGFDDETAAAFEKANWLFVQPNAATRATLSNGQNRDVNQVGKAIRRANGRLGIATDVLTVQLDPALHSDEAEAELEAAGLEVVTVLKFAKNLFEVRTTIEQDALDASVSLHANPAFVFAEPSFVEHIPQRFTPTDPRYADQWQWSNSGAGGGVAGADVNIEPAWDHTFGAGIRVAVIDNGFDAGHEDLAAGIASTSGFFSGSPVTFTQSTVGMPDSNHGTFCAGMVGARRSNGDGGVGAAPECELSLIACLGDQVTTQVTLARAVAYAGDPSMEIAGANPADGADILVSSLGPNGADWDLTTVLQLAIENAAANGRQGRGMAIFWAASNGDVDVMADEVVSHADVIAVVRSARDDTEDGAASGPEVELTAPGVDVVSTFSGDNYGDWTGTSFAAPCAAGCAALALSANPDLSRNQLRQIMRDTAEKIGGVVYDASGHHADYGFGRVDAFAAVKRASRRVRLLTTSVVFNDVPEGETTARAVVWEVSGLETLTFEVISGPTTLTGAPNSFSLLLGPSTNVTGPGLDDVDYGRIWLIYTGTTPGATATGTLDVRCVQTGETATVSISANTIARPTTAVVMVMDQSGSMDFDAGDGRKRVEVLRESAAVLVDVLKPDTGIGVVRFDHDASPVMNVVDAGPEVFGVGRAQATALVASHAANAAGATSIGDGIEAGGLLLDAVTGAYDKTAMIVLTDGQENSSKFIADVAGSIDDTVFAIGLGTPSAINPAALSAVTNGSGGYVQMTGVLSPDERFVLSKFYLQILAGVTNEQIVLDPDGTLAPGATTSIPFVLTRADAATDVIVLSPFPAALNVVLETPNGIKVTAASPGVSYVAGKSVSYYRFSLPHVDINGKDHWAGTWIAHLECDKGAFRKYLSSIEGKENAEFKYAVSHGLRFALEIHTRSSLKLTSNLDQKDIAPGSAMRLSARLSEFDLPVDGGRAKVRAEIVGPSGPSQISLKDAGNGFFEADYVAKDVGVYRFRIVGEGKTFRGERFTREQTLCGSIYFPRPPEGDPKPNGDAGTGHPGLSCKEVVEVFIKTMAKEPRLVKQLDSALRPVGLTLRSVFSCLEEADWSPRKESVTAVANGNALSSLIGGGGKLPLKPLEFSVMNGLVDAQAMAGTLRAAASLIEHGAGDQI